MTLRTPEPRQSTVSGPLQTQSTGQVKGRWVVAVVVTWLEAVMSDDNALLSDGVTVDVG